MEKEKIQTTIIRVLILLLAIALLIFVRYQKYAIKKAEVQRIEYLQTHPHEYEDGICKICGHQCQHERYIDSYCEECGKECPHEKWAEVNVCAACGLHCKHPQHRTNGLCSICSQDCQHPYHDKNAMCLTCGAKVFHSFVGGVCSGCSRSYNCIETYLDMQWFTENTSAPGTVIELPYTTQSYTSNSGEKIEKMMQVYLPAGYTTEEKYNVVILAGDYGSDENYWFRKSEALTYYDSVTDLAYPVSTKNLLDNMLARNECQPLIVAAISPTLTDTERLYPDQERDAEQMQNELRKDILPAIVSNFSTYAEGTGNSQITAARDHFGYIGAGYGAAQGYAGILPNDLDLFSWFGLMASYNTPPEIIQNKINQNGLDQYRINYFYISCGQWDSSCKKTSKAITDMLEVFGLNIGARNINYTEVPGAFHEGRVWENGVFNSLHFFFAGYGN